MCSSAALTMALPTAHDFSVCAENAISYVVLMGDRELVSNCMIPECIRSERADIRNRKLDFCITGKMEIMHISWMSTKPRIVYNIQLTRIWIIVTTHWVCRCSGDLATYVGVCFNLYSYLAIWLTFVFVCHVHSKAATSWVSNSVWRYNGRTMGRTIT